MMRKVFNIELLCQLVRHDAASGTIYWLHRPETMFARRQDFLRWNGRFEGRLAFNAPVGQGYLGGRIHNKNFFAHRVIWALQYGEWPDRDIDHINGDRADNRILNLRLATRAENARNRGANKGTASLYAGVSWHGASRKWRARATIEGRRVSLGLFPREADAALARDQAVRATNDPFVRLNNQGHLA
jgi:hypothetical protein